MAARHGAAARAAAALVLESYPSLKARADLSRAAAGARPVGLWRCIKDGHAYLENRARAARSWAGVLGDHGAEHFLTTTASWLAEGNVAELRGRREEIT